MDYTDVHSLRSDFRRGLIYSPAERERICSSRAATAARLAASQQVDKALEDLIKYQSSALAPIRTVPQEILTLIFFLAIDGIVVPYVETESPWNIAGVCNYWKGILYSTPTLWCHFKLEWSQFCRVAMGSRCNKEHTERLGHFLTLSSNLPHHIAHGKHSPFAIL
ncbi:hypothetical protein BKA70DRAFT_44289 [Coprinopsis sp. MPI-PUGE-AT-0042]|nr:hypothetical protein BKA70DRAFT_44289 [Coprinopsis sp. MPI-PUGE-AT-0042]